MSEEQLSNQDIDLSGVDISRPLLPRQQRKCRTGEVKWVEQDGKRSLVIPLTLEEPALDTRGNTVNVGFVATDRILATPTGGLTQEMINQRLARFQVAVLRLDKPERWGDTTRYSGQEVMVTFDVRADKQNPDMQYQDVKGYAKVK